MVRSTFRSEQVGRTRVSGLDFSIPSANDLLDISIDKSSREFLDRCPSWSATPPIIRGDGDSHSTFQSHSHRSAGALDMVVEEQSYKNDDSLLDPLSTADSSKSMYSIQENEDPDDFVIPTVLEKTESDDLVIPTDLEKTESPSDDERVDDLLGIPSSETPSDDERVDDLLGIPSLETGYVSA